MNRRPRTLFTPPGRIGPDRAGGNQRPPGLFPSPDARNDPHHPEEQMNRPLVIGMALFGLWLVARARAGAAEPAPVRNAGPSQMQDPPRHWDEVDERLDESFPASDPPGGY